MVEKPTISSGSKLLELEVSFREPFRFSKCAM